MSHDLRLTWQVEGRPVSTGLEGVSPRSVAETVPGESTRAYGALAKELKIGSSAEFVGKSRPG